MKYELALTSIIFFWMILSSLLIRIFYAIISMVGGEIPSGSYLTWYAPLVIISTISFIGSVLLLITARNNSFKYYWLIPLCLTILALLVVGVDSFLKLFSADTNMILLGIMSLMLAPCSLPLFISLPNGGWVRSISLSLTGGLSLYSVLATIFIVDQFIKYGDNIFDGIIVLLLLYWMFFMPIIGVLFIVNAWYWPHSTPEKNISENG
jgi:hypothetical protein